MSNIKHVTILGTGVLGSQIAFQNAYLGFTVSVVYPTVNSGPIVNSSKAKARTARRFNNDP